VTQTCAKCGRLRPETIADPSCIMGGYCDWSPGLGDLTRLVATAAPFGPVPSKPKNDPHTLRALVHRASWPSMDAKDVVLRLIDEFDELRKRLDKIEGRR
jgi:hypothetical protein